MQIAIEGIFEADALAPNQRDGTADGVNGTLLVEDITVVGAVRPADVLKELRRSRRLVHGQTLSDVHALDRPELLEKLLEHIVLPIVLAGDMTDRVVQGDHRVGLPSGARSPMKDHAVGWTVPFRPTHLLHLVFDDLVGPGPVQEIKESGILRF